MYTYIYMHKCVCMYIQAYMCIHARECIIHIFAYVRVYLRMHSCAHIRLCIYISACICIRTYTCS